MPTRIQRKRTKGWRMPERAINVTRPSIWSNPFIHDDPSQAVNAYRRLIQGGTQEFEMGPGKLLFASSANPYCTHWDFATFVKNHIHELRGKDLACWCSPDGPCHADVLLKLAN